MGKTEEEILESGENLVKKSRLFLQWGSVAALSSIGAVFVLIFIGSSLTDVRFNEILYEHLAAAIGVPLSALTALALVMALENVAGNIELETFGLKFKGASGPIIMWVICFLALVAGIKALW
ncbi:hypothetical protein [Microbulbifer hydrolyticus]|uniref:Uncharacterized protein n=1 Tax=Microbulbifer hydrolyticus TaxID=48074 RepID=A0A6P1TD31_9GAMM|nr:hypothetical protein [Microbulbifer hydrolyticus]MBB5213321.1 hypothetical protein [Microbulbifer hydrolyticus]QHQ38612.1 hypothetical protein GTQ55_06160 [Microbulbifer hydrolyticus]